MSRGPGRMMLAVCDALRAASGPLTFLQLGNAVYGSQAVERYRRGRRQKVTLPAGDTSNLRRALNGLIRRGLVAIVGGTPGSESPRRRHATRYVVSDRSTGNEERPANDVTSHSLVPELVIARGRPANDVALDGDGSTESSNSSVRLTPSEGVAASIRGELLVPARVFDWERGLLSALVDDLLQDLGHAAKTSNDPDP